MGSKKMIFLDTNAVIWLLQGELKKFSEKTRFQLETQDLFISPLVKLELQYLYEIKRINEKAEKIIKSLYESIGLQIHNVPLAILLENSLFESWTRDPFDRLITTHAKIEKAYLVSKDQSMIDNYDRVIF
jgi:PIN domain nuclease of toxin-antitoxin system